jgi:hypothetical protein
VCGEVRRTLTKRWALIYADWRNKFSAAMSNISVVVTALSVHAMEIMKQTDDEMD